MNQQDIFKKVGGILNELNEQYEYLSQSPDHLNDLELELFSANANFLSDHIHVLLKMSEKAAKAKMKVSSEGAPAGQTFQAAPQPVSEAPAPALEEAAEAQPEAVQQEDPAEQDTQPPAEVPDWKADLDKDHGFKFDFELAEEEAAAGEPEKASDEKINGNTVTEAELNTDKPEANEPDWSFGTEEDEQEESEDPEGAEEPFAAELVAETDETADDPDEKSVKSSETSGEDSVAKEVVITERTVVVPVEQAAAPPTLNDILSRNHEQQSLSSQFGARQVKDLKSMISLNDKLLFVRDLFNGYSLAYSEAIELLNRFDGFEAADNFLKQNYASKNNWADRQDTADKFYEILNRRFSK